jgi:hypothetical protein
MGLISFHRFSAGMNLCVERRFKLTRSALGVACTHSDSIFALSFVTCPRPAQNSSKVASEVVCTLTLECQGAPSCGPLGAEYVLTLYLVKVFPSFQDSDAFRISCAEAKISASDGISVRHRDPLTSILFAFTVTLLYHWA